MQLCKHLPPGWATYSEDWKLITSRKYGYSYKNLAEQKLQCQKPLILTHTAKPLLAKYMFTASLITGVSPPKYIRYCENVLSVGKKTQCIYKMYIQTKCMHLRSTDWGWESKGHKCIQYSFQAPSSNNPVLSSEEVRGFPQDSVNFITC